MSERQSNWKPSLAMMTSGRIESLHQAATNILARTGVNVHHAEMRRKLQAAGARLGDEARVYISPEMVDAALRTARKQVVVHDRNGQPAMTLGPQQCYYGTGSDLVFTRDLHTGQHRPSVLSDVAQAAQVCDALPEIDFVMSFALPGDVPADDVEPQQYYAMVTQTTKPVIMTSYSGLDVFERFHAMACLLAGGDEAFRQCPNYIIYGQFVSPLQHDPLAVDRLIFCADHEIPLIYIPTIMPAASGPITLAGSLALAVAESLAGLVMQQVQHPGAPFIFGACVSQLDMRTMLFPYGTPEWRLNDLVMAEMSRFYGLPVFGTAGTTDAKTLDAQAGAEYASSMLVAAMAGTNLIHDVGYLDAGMTGSLESIVMGAEQIRWVKRFLAGVSATEEDFALDALDEVGPGHQFLDHPHTLRHLRQTTWTPLATDRDNYDAWVQHGEKDYAARARQLVLRILQEHHGPQLSPALDQELRTLAHL